MVPEARDFAPTAEPGPAVHQGCSKWPGTSALAQSSCRPGLSGTHGNPACSVPGPLRCEHSTHLTKLAWTPRDKPLLRHRPGVSISPAAAHGPPSSQALVLSGVAAGTPFLPLLCWSLPTAAPAPAMLAPFSRAPHVTKESPGFSLLLPLKPGLIVHIFYHRHLKLG